MKRYLLTLLTLLAVVVTVGTFTSCKDTEEDLYNEVKSDNLSLEKALEEQEANLTELRQLLEEYKCECDETRIDELEELISKIDAQLGSDYSGKTIVERLNDLETTLLEVEGAADTFAGLVGIDPDFYTIAEELAKAYQNANTALAQATENAGDIQALIDSLKSVNDEIIENVNAALGTEATSVAEVAKAVAEATAELQDQVDDLLARVAALEIQISGIIVQGTYNPSFGSFSLPIGMQTNVLMAYYGTANDKIIFPTSRTGNYATGSALTAKDMEMIGFDDNSALFNSGDLIYEADDNGNIDAGTLYVTVNPSSVDFSGRTLTLENSQATESYVKLEPLSSSDKVLTFGWTRAQENAFYEAHAYLPTGDINNVQKVSLNTSAVRDMVNELLSNTTSANFHDIAANMISVVTSASLDALAVKANNMNTDGSDVEGSAVYSNYNLAATAVKPLGFTSLDAVGSRLSSATNTAFNRVYSVIDGLFASLYDMNIWSQLENMDLSVNVDDLDLTLGLSLDVDDLVDQLSNLNIDDLAGIDVAKWNDYSLSGAEVDDNNGNYFTFTGKDPETGNETTYYVVRIYISENAVNELKDEMDNFDDIFTLNNDDTSEYYGKYYVAIPINQIELYYLLVYQAGLEDELVEQLGDAFDELTDYMNNLDGVMTSLSTMLEDLADQINSIDSNLNEMMEEVLNETMGDMLDEVNDMLSSIVGLRDTISNYQGTIDSYIETIQHYVTTVVDNISALAHPTLFVTDGNDYLSPSQSRYAPSKVGSSVTLTPTSWTVELVAPICKKHVAITNVFNGSASAQGGDTACTSALKAANALDDMNEVIDGSTFNIELSGLQSGYTYEIAYSALDYNGKIITYKYYIQAK